MRLFLVLLAGALLHADVSYDSTTRITGGALVQLANMPMIGGRMKEALKPQVSRTALKGDQMAFRSEDSGTIIDVGKETITHINVKEQTYTAMTFAQAREQYEKAMAEMKKKSDEQKADLQMEFDIKETGRSQTIDNFDCREVLLITKMTGTDPKTGQSGAFVVNDVMWIAKSVPGTDEVRRFYERMAQKLNFHPTAFRQAAATGFGQGLAEVQKKARAMEGVAIVQTITVTAKPEDLPKGGEVPTTTAAIEQGDAEKLQQQQAQSPTTKQVLGSALGGLGGFGRKKKEQTPSSPPPTSEESAALMQMRIIERNFSTGAADPSLFEIPAGFKQIEARR